MSIQSVLKEFREFLARGNFSLVNQAPEAGRYFGRLLPAWA